MNTNARHMAHNGQVVGTWDDHRSCWTPEYGKQAELAAQLGPGWTFDEYFGAFFGPPAEEREVAVDARPFSNDSDINTPRANLNARRVYVTDRGGCVHEISGGWQPTQLQGQIVVRKDHARDSVPFPVEYWVFDHAGESKPAPAVAEGSHESETSVPDGNECSPSSEPAPLSTLTTLDLFLMLQVRCAELRSESQWAKMLPLSDADDTLWEAVAKVDECLDELRRRRG